MIRRVVLPRRRLAWKRTVPERPLSLVAALEKRYVDKEADGPAPQAEHATPEVVPFSTPDPIGVRFKPFF